jgi:hypothetical protein
LVESKAEAHEGEDALSVTKAEYVLSVLLRLGKLDYDADVHVWAQVCAVRRALPCRTPCAVSAIRWCGNTELRCLNLTLWFYVGAEIRLNGRGRQRVRHNSQR